MFRKITIVRLVDNNSLLNFNLRWPAKTPKRLELKSNIDILRYAGVLKGNLARGLLEQDKQSGFKAVIVPMHGSEWLADISEVQYVSLTTLIQSVFPNVSASSSKQYWYLPQAYIEHDLFKGTMVSAELEALELSLYAHGVNQSRTKYQQPKITGFMLGKVGQRVRKRSVNLVGGSQLVSLFQKQISLNEWLAKPRTNCILVMGKESGDQELYQVKETLLHMMETAQCDLVEVIQKSSHDVYAASWFYKLYSDWKDYIFSKQAI